MTTRDAEAIARRIVWDQQDQWSHTSPVSAYSVGVGSVVCYSVIVDSDALAQLIEDELRPLQKPKKGKRK